MSSLTRASIQQLNQVLDSAGLEWFGFRLPGLRIESYFYYKHVNAAPYVIGTHQHQHWEVSRLVAGKADFFVDEGSGEFAFTDDSEHYLVIPPEVPHRWSLAEGPLILNSWQIQIKPDNPGGERLIALLREKALKSRYILPATPVQLKGEQLLEDIASVNFPPGILGPMLNGVARVVIGSLVSSIDLWPTELVDEQDTQDSASFNLAKKIQKFMELNLHNSVKLVDLESHFHYSGRHLNRIFHQHFDQSIGQFLRERRFELALRWLATTNRSVKDIALSLGYGTVSHFCRFFRERTNLSPMQYREESRATGDSNGHSPSWNKLIDSGQS